MRYESEFKLSISKITGLIITAILVIVAGFILWSGKIADEVYSNAENTTPADSAQWVQSSEKYYDGTLKEWYFFTCENNGRKEGTVYELSEGLWHANSTRESSHWDTVNDDFHTKEQAQQAVEKFVKKFEMCSEEHK